MSAARAAALVLAAVLLGLPVSSPARGQEAAGTEVETVVVTARRAGVPVWRATRGGSTVVLVGNIEAVPLGTSWSPGELERAVGLADAVILPAKARISGADLGRALFRHRSILGLPRGKTLNDYVPPELSERLRVLRSRGLLGDDYLTTHPQSVGIALQRAVGARDRGGPDAVTIVRQAAETYGIPAQPISVVGAGGLITNFLAEGPAGYVRCLERSVTLAEQGAAPARERAENWMRSRVPEVLASPVEPALGACGAAPPGLSRALRAEWRDAVDRKLNAPGVTLAVVPLRFLAERGGLLDRLEAQGVEVQGPRWRAEEAP